MSYELLFTDGDVGGPALTYCEDPDEPRDTPKKSCNRYLLKEVAGNGQADIWLCDEHAP